MGSFGFVGGHKLDDQYVFDVAERLQSLRDGNQLLRELDLFIPVTLVFAEDRGTVDVRYRIDNYSDGANDV